MHIIEIIVMQSKGYNSIFDEPPWGQIIRITKALRLIRFLSENECFKPLNYLIVAFFNSIYN